MIFVLGDTSYGACCVDEVAAQHLDAEIVVHYGRACLTPTSHMPAVWVLGKEPVDMDACVAGFVKHFGVGGKDGEEEEEEEAQQQQPEKTKQKVLLLSDCIYAHKMVELEAQIAAACPHIDLAVGDCEELVPVARAPGFSKRRQQRRRLGAAGGGGCCGQGRTSSGDDSGKDGGCRSGACATDTSADAGAAGACGSSGGGGGGEEDQAAAVTDDEEASQAKVDAKDDDMQLLPSVAGMPVRVRDGAERRSRSSSSHSSSAAVGRFGREWDEYTIFFVGEEGARLRRVLVELNRCLLRGTRAH